MMENNRYHFKKHFLSFVWIIGIFFFSSYSLPTQTIFLWGEDWPIYKGNVYFTANNDDIAPLNQGILWYLQTDNIINAPIASEGVLYFTTRDGYLHAVNQQDGKRLYKKKLFLKALRSLVLKEKYLIVTDFQWLYCYDKKTGEIIWARKDYDNGIYTTPTIKDNIIYYGSRKRMFAKLISNGHDLWNNPNIPAYDGFTYSHGNQLLYLSKDIQKRTLTLFCFDGIDGKVIWQKKIPYAIKTIAPVVYRNQIYATSSSNVLLLSSDGRQLIREKTFSDYITGQIAFSDNAIIFPLRNGTIIVAEAGSLQIRQNIQTGFISAPHFSVIGDEIHAIGVTIHKKKDLQLRGFSIESGKQIYNSSLSQDMAKQFSQVTIKNPIVFSSGLIVAGGKIFAAAGNILYAIGKKRIISPSASNPKTVDADKSQVQVNTSLADKKTGKSLSGKLTAITRDKIGNIIDKQTLNISKGQTKKTLTIPKNGITEIVASKDNYFPNKVVLQQQDKKMNSNKSISLEKIEINKSIVVENIAYTYNKASLNPSSTTILEELKTSMLKNPKLKIKVIGHTDNAGSDDYNQKLSERRAETVKTYLVKNGIFQERIQIEGMGEKKPIASNQTEAGRSKNRRTEFIILDK